MQENPDSKAFAQRIMEGLSKKTVARLRKLKKNNRRNVDTPGRPTTTDIQPFSPAPTALSGPGSFGPVSVGMHGHW